MSSSGSESDIESGDDVSYESSTVREEDIVEELLPAVESLIVTYDGELMSHITQDEDENKTVEEPVDMDLSELGEIPIELDIPAISLTQQQTNQGLLQKETLLPDTYIEEVKESVGDKLDFVLERKLVCCSCRIEELFKCCMDRDCNMPVVDLKQNYVGCVLEVRWRCKAGHVEDWQSSKKVNNVYVNNIQAASALLFTGNNFVKISLFAKCFQLAFF